MKKLKEIFLTVLLLLSLRGLLSADSLTTIDGIVQKLGSYIMTKIPDLKGNIISVDTFSVDFGENIPLGTRIKNLLELYLVNKYAQTKIKDGYTGPQVYQIRGDIQLYNEKIRILIRIFNSDETLIGGTYVDVDKSPFLKSLVSPIPSVSEGETPNQNQVREDPFEPDDNPGFEVELSTSETNIFERSLAINDIDRFIFQLRKTKTLNLTVKTNINLQALLFKDDENYPIAASEESEDGTGVYLNIQLTPGVYIIVIQGVIPGVEGNYKLTASFSTSEGKTTHGNILPVLKEQTPITGVISAGEKETIKIQGDNLTFYTFSCKSSGRLRIDFFNNAHKKLFSLKPSVTQQNIYENPDENPSYDLYTALFIVEGSILAEVKAIDRLNTSISYTMELKKTTLPRIFPDSRVSLTKENKPIFVILRIISQNKYIFDLGLTNTYDFQILSLPDLSEVPYNREKENKFDSLLGAGDYIIRINPTGHNINFNLVVTTSKD